MALDRLISTEAAIIGSVRNLIAERPTRDLHGGPAFARGFVNRDHLEGRRVLDIGCGFGWFELVALDRGAQAVTGIEPTADDLATAIQHLDGRVDLQVASALDLPFSDAAFDTVVCWEVLEHLPAGSEPQTVSEIARVLAPGGALYLSTPSADLRSRVTDPAWWLTGHRHYTSQRLRELAEGAGLVVERLISKGAWWQIVAMMDLYVAKWIFHRRPFIEDRINRRVDREWGWGADGGFTNLYLHAWKPGV